MESLQTLKLIVVGLSLAGLAFCFAGPFLARAAKCWTRYGLAFALISAGFLVSMASKPGPTPTTHTVTFDLGGHGTRTGGGELIQKVPHAEAATAPTVQPNAGYEFTGWDSDFSRVISDMTVNARWEQLKYKVDIDGVVDENCVYGQRVTAATFAERTAGGTNVVCRGWTGTGDVPATGVGTQVTFTVTQSSSLRWVYGTNYWVSVDAVSLPRQSGGDDSSPTRRTAASTCEGGSVVLKDAAGATLPTNELWAVAGTNLIAEATADEGWRFVGWTEDGGGLVSEAASRRICVDRPIALCAEFERTEGERYTITFDLGEHGVRTGGGELVQTVPRGEAAEEPVVETEKYYTLVGWDTDFSSVTSNLTVNALYSTSMPFIGAAVADDCVEMGKVSGSKFAKTGTKVTLKATANRGYVFSRWVDAADEPVSQNPTYSVTAGTQNEAYIAWFLPVEEDWVELTVPAEVTNATKEASEPIVIGVAGGSLPTVKVTRLPTGLKFTAKALDVKDAKTKVVTHYEANTIYGTPTKSGVFTATVTATTAGKKTATETIKFVVRAAGETVVDAVWDSVRGKVTGMGVYSVGRKVTLKATANRGFVFSGWYEGAELLSRVASHVLYVPEDDVCLDAVFVTSEEDSASIRATVNGMVYAEEDEQPELSTNVMCGVAVDWPVTAEALSTTTVAAKGLPTGLKLVQDKVTKEYSIAGVPSAASKTDKWGVQQPSEAKITVTTAGKNKKTYVLKITVDPLPTWAYGTFDGAAVVSNDDVVVGVASMTVAASGRISGKYALNGSTWTFSASGYAEFRDDELETNRLFVVETVAKSGRQTRDLRLEVTPGWIANQVAYRLPDVWIMAEDLAAYAAAHAMVWPYDPPFIAYTQEVNRVDCSRAVGSDSAGAELVLHRNIWKGSSAPAIQPCRNLVVDPEKYPDVKATVTTSGSVKFTGKLPDGMKVSSSTTAYLVPGSEKPRALLLVPTSKIYDGWLDEVICPSDLWLLLE